ncbi:MAG: chitobiase/beta-hexosaminidase C-terminal domain-containing protein [Myxococcota bacterium]
MRTIGLCLSAGLLACGGDPSAKDEAHAPVVVALPGSMAFDAPLEVRLEADVPASIFYTLDGTSPNGADAQVYEGPLQVAETTLLSFVARSDESGLWSGRGSELYEHVPAVIPFRPLERALEISEDVVFFAAEIGDEVMEETIHVHSVGLQPVRVDAIFIGAQGAFHEPGVFEIEVPAVTSLAPGAMLDILVRYHVTSTLRTAELVLETNDLKPKDGRWSILLGGRQASW